jgi:hypothetical protein
MKITFFQTVLKVMRGPCEKGTKCIFLVEANVGLSSLTTKEPLRTWIEN